MKRETLSVAPLTAEQHVRLEIIRMIHVYGKDEQTILDRAAKLERYVLEGATPAAEAPGQ